MSPKKGTMIGEGLTNLEDITPEERHRMAMEAEDKIRMAVGYIIGNTHSVARFFAVIMLKLMTPRPVWLPGHRTMAVDGRSLWFDPEFTLKLDRNELIAVLLHEAMHLVCMHITRFKGMMKELANIAGDLEINSYLVEDMKLKLPGNCCLPGAPGTKFEKYPKGLTMEEYYDLLMRDPSIEKIFVPGYDGSCGEFDLPKGGSGKEGLDDGKGGKIAGGRIISPEEVEQEIKEVIEQAREAAKQRGALPAGLDRFIAETMEPQVPWQTVLQEFMTQRVKTDPNWNRPNKRYLAMRQYMPRKDSVTVGNIFFAIDTSGSIGQAELDMVASEAMSLASTFPCKITFLYHDAVVQHVQVWEPQDGDLELEPKGGGGTDHAPVFEWLKDNGYYTGEEFSCIIFLTDYYTAGVPNEWVDQPALWIIFNNDGAEPPFGETLYVKVNRGE